MITKQIIDSAANIANSLEGITIDTYKASPLMDLCRNGGLDAIQTTRHRDDGSLDADVIMALAAKAEHATGRSKALAAKVADVTQAQISSLRGSVIPLIKETCAACTTHLESVNAEFTQGYLADWSVCAIAYPYFILDSVFKLDLNTIGSNIISYPVRARLLGLPARKDFTQFALTGDSDLDPEILEAIAGARDYFESLGATLELSVWYSLFSNVREPKLELTQQALANMDPVAKAGLGAVIYLVAKGVMSTVDGAAVLGEDPDSNRKALAGIANWGLSLTRSAEARQAANDQQGVLMIGANTKSQTLLVNKTVYTEWLAAGGMATTLAGAVMTGHTNQLTLAGVKDVQLYRERWDSHLSHKRAAAIYSAKTRIRGIIARHLLLDSPADLTRAELSYHSRNPDYIKQANTKINEILSQSGLMTIADTTATIEACLVRGRFYFSDAYVLLECLKENSALGLAEAELIARIEYAAKWLVSQVDVHVSA